METNIPVISAIIERNNNGTTEVLIQTRWKPNRDPIYSGLIEIPAGWIDCYENVFDAVKREVLEETGLTISSIKQESRSKIYKGKNDDENFAFMPFCCQQQLKGGKPWIGFVFICEAAAGNPVANPDETRDPRWMPKSELQKIFTENPEKIFNFQLGALEYYFKQ